MISIPVYQLPFASNKAKGRAAAILVAHALVDGAIGLWGCWASRKLGRNK